VHHERVPDEIRHDRAIARPCLERLAAARAPLPLDFGQQPLVHVRPFFHRSTHLSALPVVSLFYKSTDYWPPCREPPRPHPLPYPRGSGSRVLLFGPMPVPAAAR